MLVELKMDCYCTTVPLGGGGPRGQCEENPSSGQSFKMYI